MTVVECLPIGVLAHRCAILRDTHAPCRANVRRGGACCLDIKRAKALIRRSAPLDGAGERLSKRLLMNMKFVVRVTTYASQRGGGARVSKGDKGRESTHKWKVKLGQIRQGVTGNEKGKSLTFASGRQDGRMSHQIPCPSLQWTPEPRRYVAELCMHTKEQTGRGESMEGWKESLSIR